MQWYNNYIECTARSYILQYYLYSRIPVLFIHSKVLSEFLVVLRSLRKQEAMMPVLREGTAEGWFVRLKLESGYCLGGRE